MILACISITGSDHQAEAGLLFPIGAGRIMCGSQVIWYLLVLSCPIVTVNGQVQQPQTEKVSEHSKLKDWVTSPRKPPRAAEKIAEGTLSTCPPYPAPITSNPLIGTVGFPPKLSFKIHLLLSFPPLHLSPSCDHITLESLQEPPKQSPFPLLSRSNSPILRDEVI